MTGGKRNEDKKAMEKAKDREFPFDIAYTFTENNLIATTNFVKERLHGKTPAFHDKWQMWDDKRLSAYFTPVNENTPLDVVLKKRCSAEGHLWELWLDFEEHGHKLTVPMAKAHRDQTEKIKKYVKKKDPEPAPSLNEMLNSMIVK